MVDMNVMAPQHAQTRPKISTQRPEGDFIFGVDSCSFVSMNLGLSGLQRPVDGIDAIFDEIGICF